MDIARYKELKEKNAISLMAVGNKGHFAVGVSRFDPHGGAELDPALERVTREMVESAKAAFQQGVESCDALLADMDAAVVPAKA